MTTWQFKRGLDDDFVKALNDEYRKDGWWRHLVDDRETFLAIRDDYVNVYYCGCSLLELRRKQNNLVGSVHYKYLLRPSPPDGIPEYVTVLDGKPEFRQNASCFFQSSIPNVDEFKRAATPFAGEEKTGVHDIILGNPNVFDVEVAISDAGTPPRIDLAAMHQANGRIEVRFYEAKRFSNSELRAKEGREPKVLGQLNTYAKLLREQRIDIENSYRRVCCNLSKLAGVAERHPERHKLLKSIGEGTVQLDIKTDPYLLVFGFDADQKDGRYWKKHRDKLCKELGVRVKIVGTPKGLRLPN